MKEIRCRIPPGYERQVAQYIRLHMTENARLRLWTLLMLDGRPNPFEVKFNELHIGSPSWLAEGQKRNGKMWMLNWSDIRIATALMHQIHRQPIGEPAGMTCPLHPPEIFKATRPLMMCVWMYLQHHVPIPKLLSFDYPQWWSALPPVGLHQKYYLCFSWSLDKSLPQKFTHIKPTHAL